MGKLENVGQMTHQPSTALPSSETGVCGPGIGDTHLTHTTSQSNPSTDSVQAVVFPPPAQFLQSNAVYGHPKPETAHQNLTHITTPQANLVQGTGNAVYGHPTPETGHQNLTHITTPQANLVHGTGNAIYGHPTPEIAHQNLTHITTPQANLVHGTGIYAQTQLPSPQYGNFLQYNPTGMQPGVPVAYQTPRIASGPATFQRMSSSFSTDAPFSGLPWQTNLYDCLHDPTNAAITMVAPCVTFGEIVELLDNGRTGCVLAGVVYGLSSLVLCHWNIASLYRKRLRKIYNLVEAPMDDRWAHIFFPWCSLCQEFRELKRRGRDPSLGYKGNSDDHPGRREGSNQAGIDDPPLPQVMKRCCTNLWPVSR